MSRKPELSHIPEVAYHVLKAFMIVDERGAWTLRECLHRTELSQCSGPRDRIYALLSLVYQSEYISDLRPDCAKSSNAVFADVVLRYLNLEGDLNLLAECEIDRDGSRNVDVCRSS